MGGDASTPVQPHPPPGGEAPPTSPTRGEVNNRRPRPTLLAPTDEGRLSAEREPQTLHGEVHTGKRKRPATPLVRITKQTALTPTPAGLLDDLRALIHQTREGVAQAVNAALTLLYWQVGHRIRTEILKEKRAGYGAEICSTLSNELVGEFGNGFSRPNLFRMIRFLKQRAKFPPLSEFCCASGLFRVI